MLSRRILSGIAVMVDVALLARGQPVAAKILAERQGRPPRHLEALLQDLVRHGFLKGTRGPRGGYELARERRRISIGALVRSLEADTAAATPPTPGRVIEDVVVPGLAGAAANYLDALDRITVQDLTDAAGAGRTGRPGSSPAEFHI